MMALDANGLGATQTSGGAGSTSLDEAYKIAQERKAAASTTPNGVGPFSGPGDRAACSDHPSPSCCRGSIPAG